jgi:hypothetical protein
MHNIVDVLSYKQDGLEHHAVTQGTSTSTVLQNV